MIISKAFDKIYNLGGGNDTLAKLRIRKNSLQLIMPKGLRTSTANMPNQKILSTLVKPTVLYH